MTKTEAPGKHYFKMSGTAEIHILISVYVAWKDAQQQNYECIM